MVRSDNEGTVYNYAQGLISHADNLSGRYVLYAKDAHGDITDLLDAGTTALSTLGRNSYDAFGNGNISVYSHMGYCGEYLDSETGFIYLRNRYYAPRIGRFVSEDPIRDGLNWYVYCGNDPVNRIDPNGQGRIKDFICTLLQAQQEAEFSKIKANDEAQKNIQRSIWAHGAQYYLREDKGYLTSAWMLEHSLEDNPADSPYEVTVDFYTIR